MIILSRLLFPRFLSPPPFEFLICEEREGPLESDQKSVENGWN